MRTNLTTVLAILTLGVSFVPLTHAPAHAASMTAMRAKLAAMQAQDRSVYDACDALARSRGYGGGDLPSSLTDYTMFVEGCFTSRRR